MKKMEENSIWIWVAAVLGIVAGGWLVKHLIGPVDPIDIEEEYADDEIAFDDMVGYFKSLHLKREDGICSIVSDKHKKFHKILFKTGYTSLGLFVLNEENGQIKEKSYMLRALIQKLLRLLMDMTLSNWRD